MLNSQWYRPFVDYRELSVNGLESAISLFLKDLNALPESSFSHNFGGKTRTVADIVYEVNLVNDHIGMVMRNETPFDWPSGGWIKAPDSLQVKVEVIASFEESSQRILEIVKSFSEEQLEATVQDENGTHARHERCQFMALHLWYHSGQLNYIQTLLGDDEWHWS
jgi:hypothetical protein